MPTSPSLETIGKLVDLPLTGIAKVDATITGNRSELKAKGNLTGDGVKYDENGALTASTDFTATIPDLDVERARVSANTHATFVSIGGQNINELTAKTEYANKHVDFDATAKQPERSLPASGNLSLHPDHQEVHLTAARFAVQGCAMAAGRRQSATINYASEAVSVRPRLVNGDQADHRRRSFGRPGDSLNVTLNNIDLATVDALLLREPQLTGRLNASATVTGTKEAPSVDAKFAVDHGGFRQFKYDSFGGTATYAASGVDVDARLQQNPTTWLTVKGYAPVSSDARKKDYDLHVDSSPIDLGLVQGFTTALTRCHGNGAGEARRHRRRRRSAAERQRDHSERRVHRRADRRHLHRSSRPDRSAARQGPHRGDPRPRQPQDADDDPRRSADPASVKPAACRLRSRQTTSK